MPDEQPVYEEDGGPDLTFGDIAVGMGLVTLDQINQAVAAQQPDPQGRSRTLGEMLIDQGVLTVDEVRLVLSEQGKEMLVCSAPACGRRYNVRDYKSERTYRCKVCGERMGLPGAADRSPRVDGEAGDSAVDWRPVLEAQRKAEEGDAPGS